MLRKPSLKKELRGEMVWLDQRFIQSSLEPFVLSFYMLDQLMFVQRVGGRSRTCICLAWEISPTLIVVPAFYLTKKNKKEIEKSSTSWNTRSLNFITIIITLFLLFITTIINFFTLFYVVTQLFII
jgi:cytochrome c biogenesis factor